LNAVLQVAAGLGGLTFIGGIITALALWKKNGADAASVLTDRALKAATTAIENVEQRAEKLSQQLEKTQDQLERTQHELRAVRRHMGVLEALLRDRGVPVPELVWPPAGWSVGD
jgi:DNA repair ATPase RecN